MAFLFDLVRRGVFEEITFNRLVVGHTHEDIDALFSIISRHIAGLGIEYEPTVDCFDEAVVAAFKISAATGRTYNEAVLTRIHVTYDWTKYYTPQLDPVWSANALNFSLWHHWRFHMDTASSTFQASYKYFKYAHRQKALRLARQTGERKGCQSKPRGHLQNFCRDPVYMRNFKEPLAVRRNDGQSHGNNRPAYV